MGNSALQSSPPWPEKSEAPIIPITHRFHEAAVALGISEWLLWEKTNSGEIPHVRLGTRVLNPVHVLRDWLAVQAGAEKP